MLNYAKFVFGPFKFVHSDLIVVNLGTILLEPRNTKKYKLASTPQCLRKSRVSSAHVLNFNQFLRYPSK